ncbi:MAG: SDR family oxidoreductase [Myxococcales bacterium]|nr:SDR family oxidoreductase [Myxococcales bacterium]HIK83739.1 SDR family oxidoreductase [Myxococcales bacterium]
MELEGKAAIVTGAGTGVGYQTARMLAEQGCSVLVNYSRSREGAEKAAAECEKLGVKSIAVRADVSLDEDCVAMVAEAKKAFGRLDVLVNNAGFTKFVQHENLDGLESDDWQKILGVNLMGPFFCSRAARSLLEADDGGEIVMTSSVAGLVGMGSSIAYCASKAGLNNLTVTLARALAPKIRVNAIAPGFIDGEWLKQGFGDAYENIRDSMIERTPLKRVATTETVAAGILSILMGPDLVTGHVVPHEGGVLINR